MSAIFGVLRFDGSHAAALADGMAGALSVYGEDAVGAWSSGNVAVGRRLKFTLPEDHLDPPPGEAAGLRYVVVGDVRLTERQNLIDQLGLGLSAASMSDAAIAAAAVEAWHEDAFNRIYGAFALAAWDTQEQRLLLARDHAGHRPLFYFNNPGLFAFSSMPAGLHVLPDVPRAADTEEMKRFLRLLPPSPAKTHFRDILRITPGHFAIVSKAGITTERYWKPDYSPLKLASHQAYETELSRLIESAVAAALRGHQGQVGSHLSAGFDSTTVATTAARQLAHENGRVVAFTATPREGFTDKSIGHRFGDENILAAKTAALHPNMDHIAIRPTATPLRHIDRTSVIYGQPVFNLCNEVWINAIDDVAQARGLKIMLHGAMGNATISESGVTALPELIRKGKLLTWSRIARGLVKHRWMRWRGVLWNSFNPFIPTAVWVLGEALTNRNAIPMSRYSPMKTALWAEAAVKAETAQIAAHPLDRAWTNEDERDGSNSVIERLGMMNDDMGSAYKATLATWGVDYRDPTADRRLMEFSLRIPIEHFIHEGEPRAMLRKILADRVPPEVLNNRKKGHQAADWFEGLNAARGEIVDELDRIEAFDESNALIDVARLRQLLKDWPDPGSDEWGEEQVAADYRHALLRGISAAGFIRKASGSNY